MKIITKGTHVDITTSVEEYLYKKLSSIEKFLNDDTRVQVELERTTHHHKSGDIYRVEVNIHFKGKLYRVEKISPDMYSSIDLVQDDLFNLLSTKKDKNMTLFRKGAQKIKNMFRRG